ncbi:MAG: hypothetical protein H7Y13_12455 [Sphingobacteriaceae bacterium]|nr:hypothetical protein [Sphingobacteriaceae bacterium]
MRNLVLFILLASGIMPVYAVNGRGTFQDSIKRVTIRVTASEKPRALNFDSLARARQAEKDVFNSNPQAARSSSAFASANKTDLKTVSKPSSGKKIASAQKNKTTTSRKKSGQQITSSVDDHKDEIEPEQLTVDKTSAEPENKKASRTYLWVGFMLIVVGVILGILFGKTALLISIAGMVFVIIGYSI